MSKDAILIYKPLDIEIGLRRSKRAKRISMRFTAPDKISISYPIGIPKKAVEDFISRNQNWLLDKKKRIGSNINVGIGVKIPFKGRLLLISQGKDLSSSCKIDRDKILVNSHGKNVGSQVRDFLIGEIRICCY